MAISAAEVKELRERTGIGMMLCKKALEETNGDMEKAIDNLRKQGEATLAKRAGKEAKEGTIAIASEGNTTVMLEVNSETDFVARNEDFVQFVTVLSGILLANKPATLEAALALSDPAFEGRSVEQRLIELTGKIGEKISFRRFHIEQAADNERICTYVHGGGKIGVVVKLQADNAVALASDATAATGKDCAMQIAAANAIAVSRDAIAADVIAKERDIYFTQAQNSGKPEKVWEKIVEGKLAKFYEQVVLTEQPFIRDPEIKVSERIAQAQREAGGQLRVVSFVRFGLGSE